MRKIFDTNGNDVTSAVQSTLQAGRTLVSAHLFRFESIIFWANNPFGDYGDFSFTDAEFPIYVNKYQTTSSNVASQLGGYHNAVLYPLGQIFLPENIQCGKLEYGIGFQDNPLDIDWAIDDTKTYGVIIEPFPGDPLGYSYLSSAGLKTPANITLKKALLMGAFQEAPFWVHSALFTDYPSKGGTFLGTSLLFRGFLRKVVSTRNKLVLTASSLMDVFQQVQLPTQTLTPNNRAVPYFPATLSPFFGALDGVSVGITVVTPTEIDLTNVSATIAQNELQDSWMSFQPAMFAGEVQYKSGKPMSPAWRIQTNSAISGSGQTIKIFFYEPPIIPTNPVQNVFAQTSLSTGNVGFPYLPPPEFNA